MLPIIANKVRPWFAEYGQTLDDPQSFRHMIELAKRDVASLVVLMPEYRLHVPDIVEECEEELKAANALIEQMEKSLSVLIEGRSKPDIQHWHKSQYTDGPNGCGYYSAGIDITDPENNHFHAIAFHSKEKVIAEVRRDYVLDIVRMQDAIDRLIEDNGGEWGEHHTFTPGDWRREVTDGNTRSSYWHWVNSQIDSACEDHES